MKMFVISICLAFMVVVAAPAQAGNAIQKGDVVVVPLHGEVAPSLLAFLRRAVKTAESNDASAIIFDMNTYGGRLDTATEIVNALNQIKIPTYTFINTNAGSAGALIVIATQHIYMAPVSAIGAAAPILPTGEDLPATAKEKTISYWSALIRGSATKNQHNPDVAEAFMNKDKEVKIGDRVIHPKGAVLTLNAQEATERINGKALLAEGVADSVSDLIKKAGLKGNEVTIEPTGFACAIAFTGRNSRRLLGVQNSWCDVAGGYLCDLLRAILSGALSGRPGRLGSGCVVHSRNGSRSDRDSLFRA
jgi:membrane-bound serine protease (ClpP class)